MKNSDITILCKVVDNFGDIGVVYRLAKALSSLPLENQKINLRIVCDNLKSFSLLCPQIDPSKNFQTVNGWKIYQWDSTENLNLFRENPPEVILECFQCGRPEWLDTLLFDIKIPYTVHIVMIDYLTAEDYAETFHCLKSLTRSAKVQKVNFMPGFTSKTGGLIISAEEQDFLNHAKKDSLNSPEMNAVFFSYPADLTPVLNAFETFAEKKSVSVNIQAAQGAGFKSFQESWEKITESKKHILNKTSTLPFLPQEEWDRLLMKTPLLFIRGEDSLSRACLYGHPFVWHAYPQSEDYQLVKVQALLERMRPFFKPEHFCSVEECWQIYNGKPGNLQIAVEKFLLDYENLAEGFYNFSQELKKNGDLALHLMTFIEQTCIIDKVNS